MKRWKDHNSNWKSQTRAVSDPVKLTKMPSGRWLTPEQYAENKKRVAQNAARRAQYTLIITQLWEIAKKLETYDTIHKDIIMYQNLLNNVGGQRLVLR